MKDTENVRRRGRNEKHSTRESENHDMRETKTVKVIAKVKETAVETDPVVGTEIETGTVIAIGRGTEIQKESLIGKTPILSHLAARRGRLLRANRILRQLHWSYC